MQKVNNLEAPSETESKSPIDSPILSSSQDKFSRTTTAHELSKTIRELDMTDGLVVAIMGPWGYGKSSFVNLMREQFAQDPETPTVDFNPWMFSGTQQLVEHFFGELSSQLRIKGKAFESIADGIDKYADLFSPLAMLPGVGAWFDRSRKVVKSFNDLRKDKNGGLAKRRSVISEEMAKLSEPVVVFVDDIDRLNTGEIRDIFKLVRLTANFPNLVYVLAFDRDRVEDALSEQGIDGRAYLEKIVQLGFDLPKLPAITLRSQTTGALDEVLNQYIDETEFNAGRWPDVFEEVISPLVRNMRDIKRYALASRLTIKLLHADVEVVDLLALEAVRTFRPGLFGLLIEVQEYLTDTLDLYGGNQPKPGQNAIDRLLAEADNAGDGQLARDLIRRVFPAAGQYIGGGGFVSNSSNQWLRDKRVAHKDVLSYYFEHFASDGLTAFRGATGLVKIMSDPAALARSFDAVPPEELADTMAALEVFEGDFPQDAIVPGAIALLNRIPQIPIRPRGMFDLGSPSLVVTRVVLRMLRQINDEAIVEEMTHRILTELPSLSSRLTLIRLVGHIDRVGHKLISSESAALLESGIREQIGTADQAALAREWDVVGLLWFAKSDTAGKAAIEDLHDPQLIAAMLIDSRNTVTRQSIDSRSVEREVRLNWDYLIALMGGEAKLQEALEKVRGLKEPELIAETVVLADKYLGGWRPKEF